MIRTAVSNPSFAPSTKTEYTLTFLTIPQPKNTKSRSGIGRMEIALINARNKSAIGYLLGGYLLIVFSVPRETLQQLRGDDPGNRCTPGTENRRSDDDSGIGRTGGSPNRNRGGRDQNQSACIDGQER